MLQYKNIESLKNGATLDHNLKPIAFKMGYQVGITNNISAEETIQIELGRAATIAKGMTNATGKNHYVGVWHDGKNWFVDVSLYVAGQKEALDLGKVYQQQAVFNWENKECLTVK